MPTNRRATTGTAIATLALAAGLAISQSSASAHGGHAHEPAPDRTHELTGAQRQVIREATHQYTDVGIALADGYLPTEECSALPGAGGMGYHYVNPDLIHDDGRVDPTTPEVLLYAPSKKGPKLVAVEYFVIDADGDLSTNADRPTLMGHDFDGPMPGHDEHMPVHYDLHAWVFTNNPSGELAMWNPAITCPEH